MLHHTLAVGDNLAVGHIVVVHILVVEVAELALDSLEVADLELDNLEVVDLAVDSLEVADLVLDSLEELLGCTLVAEGSYQLQR